MFHRDQKTSSTMPSAYQINSNTWRQSISRVIELPWWFQIIQMTVLERYHPHSHSNFVIGSSKFSLHNFHLYIISHSLVCSLFTHANCNFLKSNLLTVARIQILTWNLRFEPTLNFVDSMCNGSILSQHILSLVWFDWSCTQVSNIL